jgi:hypothetical protein
MQHIDGCGKGMQASVCWSPSSAPSSRYYACSPQACKRTYTVSAVHCRQRGSIARSIPQVGKTLPAVCLALPAELAACCVVYRCVPLAQLPSILCLGLCAPLWAVPAWCATQRWLRWQGLQTSSAWSARLQVFPCHATPTEAQQLPPPFPHAQAPAQGPGPGGIPPGGRKPRLSAFGDDAAFYERYGGHIFALAGEGHCCR